MTYRNTHHLGVTVLLFFLIGMPRLFTLEAHWANDETTWLARSAGFINAIEMGRFEQTHRAYHPGVTTMWLAGLRMLLQDTEEWLSIGNLARARWFISITVSAFLVVPFFLLQRVFGTSQAFYALSFLAMNPFFLAQTRKVHTDALATIFILLTVLLFLRYCLDDTQKSAASRHLIFAGIAFGLACLSKSYSLILLPWMPITLWIFRTSDMSLHEHLHRSFVTGVFFLSYSLLTVFIVWPLFWHPRALFLGSCLLGATLLGQHAIQMGRHIRTAVGAIALLLIVCACYAVKTFWTVFDGVGWALTTPHEIDYFFLGKIVADPGWLFYLFTLSIKSTPFVLPLAMGTILFLWKHRHNAPTAKHFKIALALAGIAVLFTICLSLTSKKFARYLLPAFPMLDILAGMGLFYFLKWIGKTLKNQYAIKIVQTSCVAVVLLLTAIPVFALHPYYGTYSNLCWKFTDITKIITVNETAGLDIASNYLNKKPNATQMFVQVSDIGAEFLRYYFLGNVYRTDKNRIQGTDKLRPADYEVVYIRDSQIGRAPQTGTRNGQLEAVITLNGIDHVWIYRIPKEETP